MAGDSQFGPAPDFGVPARTPLPQADGDPVALRQAVDSALGEGVAAGRVYAGVIRPSLTPYDDGVTTPHPTTRGAVARSAAHAALAQLAARHPTSNEGLGRRAVVLVPAGSVGELDGQLLADVLEAAGWTTDVIALAQDATAVVDEVERGRYELAAVPAADAGQVLASQLACSLLRRLAAPPLVVGIAFDGRAEPAALAADAYVGDADALPPLLRRRLAGGGARWGVHLARDGEGLVVAPVGVLDVTSVQRLREIVESRRMLYPRILVDLRELLAADEPGLAALVDWDAEEPWAPIVAALADQRALDALDTAGLTGILPLA